MKQLSQVVQKDPLKLKKYDLGNGQKQSRMIYVFLIGIPVLLSLSVIFYVLGFITSPSQSEPVQTNQRRNNPESSSDDDEYSNDLPPRGELFSDRSKIADSVAKVQVGLRIMPSQNDEQGIILMKWTDQSNEQEKKLGGKVDVGDHYFLFQDTAHYFPVLKYNADYVPFGDAASFCIHLQWIKRENRRMYDMYKTVQGFPTCSNAQNSKFRWQATDPKTGVDFKVWTQESYQVSSESECNSRGGIYRSSIKEEGGLCYMYMIVKRICLMVAYTEHPETASYTWEYRGGCYEGGNIAVYEKATPGEEYHFDDIPIEVREDESLYNSIQNVEAEVNSTLSPLFYFLSTLALLLAFISAVLFAVFFFKMWFAAQSNSNMRHQPQIDEQ